MLTKPVVVAGRTFAMLCPTDAELLIDDTRVAERFDQDEYMPYWAELWPSAGLLADVVAAWGPAAGSDPPTVLDLGCGLGLVGLVAVSLGYDVTLADYDEDALLFAAENARRNGLPVPRTRLVDWRETYADLRVDRIVAADVLYETRNHVPVADFVRRHLVPTGFALICDPNRTTAEGFESVARHSDLSVEIVGVERREREREEPRCGRIFRLRHQGD